MNNYNISTWSNIFNKAIYGWDLNLINTDYSLFIDTSHWEYDKNKFDKEKFKDKAKEMNLKGLIFKVSDAYDGKQFYDDSCDFWYSLANECKLLTTGYHWLQPSVDPINAFKFYNDWMKNNPCSMPYVVDFEEPSATGRPTDYCWRLQKFLENSGTDTIIYTAMGYIGTLKSGIASSYYNTYFGFMKNYTLWLAWYSRYVPKNLWPWVDWDLWQYSASSDFPFYEDKDNENAKAWGMPGAGLDMNWVKNSYLEKFSLLNEVANDKINDSTQEQIVIENLENNENTNTEKDNVAGLKFETLVDGTRIRNSPMITDNIVSTVPLGTELKAKDFDGTNVWMQIDGGQFDGKFIAYKYNGKQYLKKKE